MAKTKVTKARVTKATPTKPTPTKATPTKATPTKATPTKATPTKATPTKRVAPAKGKPPVSTRVSAPIALPASPPPPPPPRDEPPAQRDIGRLLRYGERFGAHKIDVRMWTALGAQQPAMLPVASGALAICDPAVPKSWRVFDRPAGAGQFRIMLSIARTEAGAEALAAVVIHTGRPPIARWTVAHVKGQKKSAAPPTTVAVTSGWLALMDAGAGSPGVIATPTTTPGSLEPVEIPLTDGRRALALPCRNGELTAYWAVDASDKPICLVVDLDAFTQKEWKAKPTAG